MSSYEDIKLEKADRIVVITLNRPERLNAISERLQKELISAIEELEQDDGIVAVIITGASRPNGRPCFSAGADIKEM